MRYRFNKRDLARRLRQWRQLNDITQLLAADLLGVSSKTWSRWESARHHPQCASAARLVDLEIVEVKGVRTFYEC